MHVCPLPTMAPTALHLPKGCSKGALLPAPPNCPLRHPNYHLAETIRPSIEVHWGLFKGARLWSVHLWSYIHPLKGAVKGCPQSCQANARAAALAPSSSPGSGSFGSGEGPPSPKLLEVVRGPKGHINTRISDSGSEVQYERDTRNHGV